MLKKCFDGFADEEGAIPAENVGNILSMMGLKVKPTALRSIIEEIDEDGNHVLWYCEHWIIESHQFSILIVYIHTFYILVQRPKICLRIMYIRIFYWCQAEFYLLLVLHRIWFTRIWRVLSACSEVFGRRRWRRSQKRIERSIQNIR